MLSFDSLCEVLLVFVISSFLWWYGTILGWSEDFQKYRKCYLCGTELNVTHYLRTCNRQVWLVGDHLRPAIYTHTPVVMYCVHVLLYSAAQFVCILCSKCMGECIMGWSCPLIHPSTCMFELENYWTAKNYI
jgi:hypothetical protein